MAENRRMRTPAGLSRPAARLWRDVVDGWRLDADQLVVLAAACRALDRMRAAEQRVADEGLTVVGSRGQPVAHPMLATIDTERRAVLVALKQLDLARRSVSGQARDWRGKFAKQGDLRGHASEGHVIDIDRYKGGA